MPNSLPLPQLVRIPPIAHESVCRAQSSYRETVASLRSEKGGAGHVSARVHFWHGWQILMVFLGFCWRCDLLLPRTFGSRTPPSPVEGSALFRGLEEEETFTGPRQWMLLFGRVYSPCPGRRSTTDGPFMSASGASWSCQSTSDRNRPRLLDFHPTWEKVSMLMNKCKKGSKKRGKEGENRHGGIGGAPAHEPAPTGNTEPSPKLSASSFTARAAATVARAHLQTTRYPAWPGTPSACPLPPSWGIYASTLPRPGPTS